MKTTFISLVIVMFSMSPFRTLAKPKVTFYLRNNHARIPVVVRGNTASNSIIVFIHGGPGGSGLLKIGVKAFQDLERHFKIVYWDQRASGFSSGGKASKYLTLGQYLEDMDKLIDRLHQIFPDHSIFLMGHCWGGGIGTAYLTNLQRQSKISGWIEVAGAHNNPLSDSLSMEWVKLHARKMIAIREHTHRWSRALKWYDQNPEFNSARLAHYYFVKKSHGYLKNKRPGNEKQPGYVGKDLLRHPIYFIAFYLNYRRTLSKFLVSEFDFTDEMKKIKLPVLIVWGNDDGLIPVKMAQHAFESVGTAECDKRVIRFDNCAHTVFYEQPEKFCSAVVSFVNAYSKEADDPTLSDSRSALNRY